MKLIIIALCLILLMVVQKTVAISCYGCGIGTDGCGKSFKKDGAGVVSTDSSAVYCTKTVYSSNNNAIMRGYGILGTCIEQDTTDSIRSHQYCCTTDLCNEASMGKANFIFAVITTLISLLIIN